MNLSQLEHTLANDLAVIMEAETNNAFRSKQWNGKPWPPVKTPVSRGSLMIRSGALRRSIRFTTQGNTVHITSSLPYAAIHHHGGTITMPRTPKMRRFAWAMFYKTKDPKYKAMALTTKPTLSITIPPRPFVGITPITTNALNQALKQYLLNLNLP